MKNERNYRKVTQKNENLVKNVKEWYLIELNQIEFEFEFEFEL